MVRRLALVGGVVAAVFALSQFLLPAAVNEIVSGAMLSLTDTDKVEVQVEEFPAIYMLGGHFDRIAVRASDARADKIVFDAFEMNLKNIQIDMLNLILRRSLTLRSAEDITLRAVVSEAQLASTINQSVKGARDAEVSILPDKVTVRSKLAIGGLVSATVVLEGKIVAEDGQIVFKTHNASIDNALLGRFGGSVFTSLVLVDLNKLPFDVRVKNVALDDGKAMIYADNH